MEDLDKLMSIGCGIQIRGGGLATSQGKSNCLLQSYISRAYINHSTLYSETTYISQNASRIARALFEIALKKEWAYTTVQCLNMSKYIQRRIWGYNSPLKQLVDANLLKTETVQKIEAKRYTFFELIEFDDGELGQMFNCDGRILYDCIRMIPSLDADATIKPITQTIIRIDTQVWPAFNWNNQLLGPNSQQRFILMVEDTDSNTIMHHEQLIYTQKKVRF
jgi:activating signal cointegrator complex subunit 3